MILIKEGQVYPVPPSLLPQPACRPLILLSIVRLASDFLRFNVCFGCYKGLEWGGVGWRGRGLCIDSWGPHLKSFSPAPSSHWGRCTLIRCAGKRDPRKKKCVARTKVMATLILTYPHVFE